VPPAVVLCFQDAFFDHVVETHVNSEAPLDAGAGETYRVAPDVAVVGGFGVGSGITASVVEEKAALGAETFCILGGAGCLDPKIPPDEALLATHAIRDEGASYHYLPPEESAEATPALLDILTVAITDAELSVHQGPTWTIDAFYRETVPEVRQYADDGVLTAEMEAASLFAVAQYHGLDAAAIFSIGDYVTADEREVPAAGHALLPELFTPTIDALQTHVQ
jgi:uridine phosphorylase